MKFKLYRSFVRNLLTGRELMARKLVIESSFLFSDSEKDVSVYCVAYGGEPRAEVVFEVAPHNAEAYELSTVQVTARLLDWAERGEDTPVRNLFELWRDVSGEA